MEIDQSEVGNIFQFMPDPGTLIVIRVLETFPNGMRSQRIAVITQNYFTYVIEKPTVKYPYQVVDLKPHEVIRGVFTKQVFIEER